MPRLSPARQARAYRRAIRLRERLWTALNGAFDGFWLGVLDPAALARLDEDFYSAGRDAFDGTAFEYTSGEHNLRGLYDWEAEAIERHFPAGARVVITGAGGDVRSSRCCGKASTRSASSPTQRSWRRASVSCRSTVTPVACGYARATASRRRRRRATRWWSVGAPTC
jgi:hypothetical protein